VQEIKHEKCKLVAFKKWLCGAFKGGDMNQTKESSGVIHYRYWILILLLIVIAIATDRWTGKEGFTDYLSNAATMTSLLLGLVAIIYSFVSNSTISSSLGSINTVSDEVDSVNKQIGEYIALARDIEKAGRDNVVNMAEISSGMKEKLGEFAELLTAMGDKNNEMHDLLSKLPGRLDDLDKRVGEISLGAKPKKAEGAAGTAVAHVENKIVDRLFDRSSAAEIFALYFCVKVWRGDKALDISELCRVLDVSSVEQMIHGFVRCLDSIGIVGIHSEDKEKAADGLYTIDRMNGYLSDNVEKLLEKFLVDKYEEGDSMLKEWRDTIVEVDKHFNASAADV
jgi:hypothetical protein